MVGAGNRAILRPVRVGRIVDEQWLVLDGLEPGEHVIVEGFQKFAAGDVVDPMPWRAQAADAPSEKFDLKLERVRNATAR